MELKNNHTSSFLSDTNLSGIVAYENPTPAVLNRAYLKTTDSLNILDQGLASSYRSSALITTRETLLYAQLAENVDCEIGGESFGTGGQPRFIPDPHFTGFYVDSDLPNVLGTVGDFKKPQPHTTYEFDWEGSPVTSGTYSRISIRSSGEGTRFYNTVLGPTTDECRHLYVTDNSVEIPGSIAPIAYTLTTQLSTSFPLDLSRYVIKMYIGDSSGAPHPQLGVIGGVVSGSVSSGLFTYTGTYSSGDSTPITGYLVIDITLREPTIYFDFLLKAISLSIGNQPSLIGGGTNSSGLVMNNVGNMYGSDWTSLVKTSLPKTGLAGDAGFRELMAFESVANPSLRAGVRIGLKDTEEVLEAFMTNVFGTITAVELCKVPAELFAKSMTSPFTVAVRWHAKEGVLGAFVGLPDKTFREFVWVPNDDLQATELKLRIGGNTGGLYTQFRYDTEWLNDAQLVGIHLANRKFVNGLRMVYTMDDVERATQEVGSNLLVNPNGRLHLNHWEGYPTVSEEFQEQTIQVPDTTKVDVVNGPAVMGKCFNLKSTTATNVLIRSEPIPIKQLNAYAFQGVVGLETLTAGSVSYSIQFYQTEETSTGLPPATYHQIHLCEAGTLIQTTGQVPAEANFARIIFRGDQVEGMNLYFTRLKFEEGLKCTGFSDDAGYRYAVYR